MFFKMFYEIKKYEIILKLKVRLSLIKMKTVVLNI